MDLKLKLITEPAVEPVTLAEAKEQMSIADTVQDDVITRHIVSARRYAELYTGIALIDQTWEQALNTFPTVIDLWKAPVSSITSVKYYDTSGVEQTVDSADYVLDTYSSWDKLHLAPDTNWPSTDDRVNAVKVRYVSGYGAAGSDVPSEIRDAIFMTVNQFLKNSSTELGSPTLSVAPAVKQLLNPYRVLRV